MTGKQILEHLETFCHYKDTTWYLFFPGFIFIFFYFQYAILKIKILHNLSRVSYIIFHFPKCVLKRLQQVSWNLFSATLSWKLLSKLIQNLTRFLRNSKLNMILLPKTFGKLFSTSGSFMEGIFKEARIPQKHNNMLNDVISFKLTLIILQMHWL